MKKIITTILIYAFHPLYAQNIQVVDSKWYKEMKNKKNDTTYVINFWATWCIPCVNELPAFEMLHQKYQKEKMSIVLVSLDFVNKIKETVIPFLQKKKITMPVVLLHEKGGEWINNIDTNWSGAIPLTIIWNHAKKEYKMLEKEINFDELEKSFLQIHKKK